MKCKTIHVRRKTLLVQVTMFLCGSITDIKMKMILSSIIVSVDTDGDDEDGDSRKSVLFPPAVPKSNKSKTLLKKGIEIKIIGTERKMSLRKFGTSFKYSLI